MPVATLLSSCASHRFPQAPGLACLASGKNYYPFAEGNREGYPRRVKSLRRLSFVSRSKGPFPAGRWNSLSNLVGIARRLRSLSFVSLKTSDHLGPCVC